MLRVHVDGRKQDEKTGKDDTKEMSMYAPQKNERQAGGSKCSSAFHSTDPTGTPRSIRDKRKRKCLGYRSQSSLSDDCVDTGVVMDFRSDFLITCLGIS